MSNTTLPVSNKQNQLIPYTVKAGLSTIGVLAGITLLAVGILTHNPLPFLHNPLLGGFILQSGGVSLTTTSVGFGYITYKDMKKKERKQHEQENPLIK